MDLKRVGHMAFSALGMNILIHILGHKVQFNIKAPYEWCFFIEK